jgi:RHS repeat-associated protein
MDRGGTDVTGGLEYTQRGGKYAGGTRNATSFEAERHPSADVPGISFFRNRIYDQRSGRWTQEDPIGVAGGVNLYQFNGNNPAMYTDPFGLCPEAKNGSVCIDLFIQAKQVGPFRGDGRGFNPNAAASQSRVQIVTGPGGNGTATTVSPSCIVGVGCAAPRSGGKVATTAGEGGSFTVQFEGFKISTIPFGASPDIDGQVSFTPDGEGGYTASGNTTAFPSSAVYQRVKGKWVELHRHTETTPSDLFDGAGRDQF